MICFVALYRSLDLIDDCPDIAAMRYGTLRYTTDRLLCGVLDGSSLRHALQSMPRLRSLTMRLSYDELHGLPWSTLDAIFSVHHLREIVIKSYIFCPRHFPATTISPEMLPPLTSFTYQLRTSLRRPRSYDVEREAVSAVVGGMCHSLQALTLPSASVSFTMFQSTAWRYLRSLTLIGEYPTGLSRPLVSVLGRMPELSALVLAFALPVHIDRQPIWPHGAAPAIPWPKLVDLTVSFPDPEDQIFSNLPPGLRRLSLICCPRHCFYEWELRVSYPWHSPILSATDMLRVLSSINAPSLEGLVLEYRADESDEALLHRIVTNFPGLNILEMHRFRAVGEEAVPVVSPNLVS